jgi:vacuolar-type H+-ATPase subunit H
MKEDLKDKLITRRDPQESLESVLSAEIEISSKLADAHDLADKLILEAQNNTGKLKTKIIEKARAERDRLYKEGVQKAHEDSDQSIETARKEAEKFQKNGEAYLNEAESQVMALLLGLEGQKK